LLLLLPTSTAHSQVIYYGLPNDPNAKHEFRLEWDANGAGDVVYEFVYTDVTGGWPVRVGTFADGSDATHIDKGTDCDRIVQNVEIATAAGFQFVGGRHSVAMGFTYWIKSTDFRFFTRWFCDQPACVSGGGGSNRQSFLTNFRVSDPNCPDDPADPNYYLCNPSSWPTEVVTQYVATYCSQGM
jgi:hypothetical protein